MAVAHILISSPFFALLIILDADITIVAKNCERQRAHLTTAVFVNELSEPVTLAFGKVERTNSEGQVRVSFFVSFALWREDNSEVVATDGSL